MVRFLPVFLGGLRRFYHFAGGLGVWLLRPAHFVGHQRHLGGFARKSYAAARVHATDTIFSLDPGGCGQLDDADAGLAGPADVWRDRAAGDFFGGGNTLRHTAAATFAGGPKLVERPGTHIGLRAGPDGDCGASGLHRAALRASDLGDPGATATRFAAGGCDHRRRHTDARLYRADYTGGAGSTAAGDVLLARAGADTG